VVGIPVIAFLWIEHMEYDQYKPVLPFEILLVTMIHVLLDSVFILYIINDKWPWQCQQEASKRKTVFGIASSAFLWIDHVKYVQYRPDLPFDMLMVTIHVLHDSFLFVTSPITDDGLCVNWEQATGKEWMALQQVPVCELMTWSMINIDLLYHLTYCW
jgi:hypothetical protein